MIPSLPDTPPSSPLGLHRRTKKVHFASNAQVKLVSIPAKELPPTPEASPVLSARVKLSKHASTPAATHHSQPANSQLLTAVAEPAMHAKSIDTASTTKSALKRSSSAASIGNTSSKVQRRPVPPLPTEAPAAPVAAPTAQRGLANCAPRPARPAKSWLRRKINTASHEIQPQEVMRAPKSLERSPSPIPPPSPGPIFVDHPIAQPAFMLTMQHHVLQPDGVYIVYDFSFKDGMDVEKQIADFRKVYPGLPLSEEIQQIHACCLQSEASMAFKAAAYYAAFSRARRPAKAPRRGY